MNTVGCGQDLSDPPGFYQFLQSQLLSQGYGFFHDLASGGYGIPGPFFHGRLKKRRTEQSDNTVPHHFVKNTIVFVKHIQNHPGPSVDQVSDLGCPVQNFFTDGCERSDIRVEDHNILFPGAEIFIVEVRLSQKLLNISSTKAFCQIPAVPCCSQKASDRDTLRRFLLYPGFQGSAPRRKVLLSACR